MATTQRKYNNQKIDLPNGEQMVVGTHIAENGQVSVKLRLPGNYWAATGIWRASESTHYGDGKAVFTIEQTKY